MQAIVLVAFAAAVLVSEAYVWKRYGTFDPANGRLPSDEFPGYFPVLMVHIMSSSVALATCVLQIWPWLRRHHPRIHRISGRVYIFAGVYPAAITVLILETAWPSINVFSDLITGALWLGTTTVGLVLARKRRTADHRRWMLRSFALTISVLFSQVLQPPIRALLKIYIPDDYTAILTSSSITVWLSWILPFLAVEWLLEREQLRRSARLRRLSAAEVGESTSVT